MVFDKFGDQNRKNAVNIVRLFFEGLCFDKDDPR